MFAIVLTLLLVVALVVAIQVLRSDRGGPPVSFALDDDSIGVPHDFGDGLRRINLDGGFVAQMVQSALAERGVEVKINDGGGGMLGALHAPAYVVYDAADEAEVAQVVRDVMSDDPGD